ncbi:MAG: phage Gp37/Gp68 family protein [Chloroflexota bacterium]|nr:phage Gp37/Gp68 family protein [Chloroflexota bacterium]
MAGSSSIEWTEATWNPLTGCTKVSQGCKHCYAERMAKRLQAMGHPNYATGFKLALHENLLEAPLKWKKPRTIFVNSMSDLFHPEVPDLFIHRVFNVMCEASHHRFQVLTKRPERVLELSSDLPWPSNVWMGTSVESTKYVSRIQLIGQTAAQVKFLSLEPLLGPLPNLELTEIDWVIVGGESGPQARPVNEAWVIDIRDQCISQKIPFFFKQWGGVNKKIRGRLLEGRTWDEMPSAARLQAQSPELIHREQTPLLALVR